MEDNVMRDIFVTLGELNAKVDDLRAIRQTAETANLNASAALRLAEQHEEELKDMKNEANTNRRWIVGTVITTAFSVAGGIITLITIMTN